MKFHGEYCFWVALQALSSISCQLVLVSPEEASGQPKKGEMSHWSFREFADARRFPKRSSGCLFQLRIRHFTILRDMGMPHRRRGIVSLSVLRMASIREKLRVLDVLRPFTFMLFLYDATTVPLLDTVSIWHGFLDTLLAFSFFRSVSRLPQGREHSP